MNFNQPFDVDNIYFYMLCVSNLYTTYLLIYRIAQKLNPYQAHKEIF
ncbi:hypothetical protein NSTC745_04763 [Nostoc sp. DSM 114161]|jgi:hypothetical protein